MIYFGVHFILRLGESASLRWDESEQTLFSQQLALGYNDQPPVYTWLLWCMFRLTGVSLVGVYLLKMLILAAIYAGLFVAGRRISSDRFAILAPISLLLTPYFAWSALIDGAHTLLVTAFVPVAYLVVLRLLERPTAVGFALLGVVLGFGFLAKYSFALLVIAILPAMLTIPAHRKRLVDWRLLLTVAVGGAIVLPHTMWVLNHWDLIRERPMHRGGINVETVYGTRLIDGFSSLGTTILQTIGPMLALLGVLFPRECWRIVASRAQSDSVRLLGRWLGVITLTLVLLVLLGLTRFRTHWLIPAIVIVPLYLFARMGELPAADWRRRRLFAIGCLAIVAVFAVRVAGIITESSAGGKYWAQDRLHDALAEKIADNGLDHATFVGDHTLACGNLRLHFPGARVVCSYYPAFEPADFATRPCVLIWEATYQPGLTPRFEDWLKANGLLDRLDWSHSIYVDMPVAVAGPGLRRIGILRLR
jgi:4-amino-4-deoxy-L-arabinose transferase-like glycosyltransferase